MYIKCQFYFGLGFGLEISAQNVLSDEIITLSMFDIFVLIIEYSYNAQNNII